MSTPKISRLRDTVAIAAFAAAQAVAQGPAGGWSLQLVGFSLQRGSVSIGQPGSPPSTTTIDCGTVLTPAVSPPGGTFRPPSPVPTSLPIVAGNTLGLDPFGVPWAATDECDALSYIAWQTWARARVGGTNTTRWEFSVTRDSSGALGALVGQALLGEHPADVFDTDVPGLFLPNSTPPIGNVLSLDDDCMAAGTAMFGFGVSGPAATDQLDAFAHVPTNGFVLSFYSVDTTAALAHGFRGGDVFWRNPWPKVAGPLSVPAGTWVYAGFAQLGLTLRDEVDGLVVVENAVSGYQRTGGYVPWGEVVPDSEPHMGIPLFPTAAGYSYLPDQVFFTISRRSSTVGVVDPVSGLPINCGDVLVPPTVIGNPPAIAVRAELLGLRTSRTVPVDRTAMDDADALENFPEGYFAP